MSRGIGRYGMGCAFVALCAMGCGPSFEDGTGGAGGAGTEGTSSSSSGKMMTSSTTSSTSSQASTGASTSTGMVDPHCTVLDGAEIAESCGTFVKPGGTGNGTQAAPFGSIQDAIESGNAKPIYVCAGTFEEALAIPAGVTLNGGIDCDSGWKWRGSPALDKRTVVSPKANEIPLYVVMGGSGTSEVFGFSFVAKDAAVVNGASSIAVIVAQPTHFKSVHFQAGNGMPGSDGIDGVAGNAAPLALNGTNHPPVQCSNATAGYSGGAQSINVCSTGSSTGGAGGKGGPGVGGDAVAGANGTINTPPAGNGGKGNTFIALGQQNSPCAAGVAGHPGIIGSPGVPGAGMGTLNYLGYHGVDGGDGGGGEVGGGGGGGGGARTQDSCWGGDGGGGGGAGGCGGSGGTGGKAGGSSIAVVAFTSSVSFEGCTASVGQGGNGGNGGAGGGGGAGAIGGSPGNGNPNPIVSPVACAGGAGGAGGLGGHGGGGSGGHVIGLACTQACDAAGLTIATIPPTSVGGGGAGDGTNDGSDGVAAAKLQF